MDTDRLQAPIPRDALDRILRSVFGQGIGGCAVQPLEGGGINNVYRVDLSNAESYVLRIAPTEAVAERGPGWLTAHGLRRELAVIEVASALREFLPVTVAHDFGLAVIDRDWVLQEMMPGLPLATVDASLHPQHRAAVWTELGQFTRTLHAITGDRFGPPAWGPTFARWSDQVRFDVASLIDDAATFAYPAAPFERLAECVERLAPLLDAVTTPTLIHSDLSRTHVFVETDDDVGYRLRGVIDLEFGRFADPLSEHLITGFAWSNAPVEMRPAFTRGYGYDVTQPEEEARVQLYVALSIAWLVPLAAFQGQPYDGLLAKLDRAVRDIEKG